MAELVLDDGLFIYVREIFIIASQEFAEYLTTLALVVYDRSESIELLQRKLRSAVERLQLRLMSREDG
jgi:hypothetical protein